jgi:hypothetical protein
MGFAGRAALVRDESQPVARRTRGLSDRRDDDPDVAAPLAR